MAELVRDPLRVTSGAEHQRCEGVAQRVKRPVLDARPRNRPAPGIVTLSAVPPENLVRGDEQLEAVIVKRGWSPF